MPLNVLPISRIREHPRALRGVYFIIQNEDVIYIGQSKHCLFSRVKEALKRWPSTTHAAWHVVPGGKGIDRLESDLIKFWSPIHNRAGKPNTPYWDDSYYPHVTEKPCFWYEYTQAASLMMTELESEIVTSSNEITRCQLLLEQLTAKSHKFKRLSKLRRPQKAHGTQKQEYPYIGGVLLSRDAPIFLQTSLHLSASHSSMCPPSPLLPVLIPGHSKTFHPKLSKFKLLCRKIGLMLSGML